jgi:hypothetical protein
MNELIAKMWVNALRSGEYQQGKGTLHNQDTNTYCCLGVLCDLYVQETNNRDSYCQQRMLSDSSIVTAFGNTVGTLPNQVLIWSGVNDDNGRFKYSKPIPSSDGTAYFNDEDFSLLTSMNDGAYGHDFTFEEIATIIEEQWRQL